MSGFPLAPNIKVIYSTTNRAFGDRLYTYESFALSGAPFQRFMALQHWSVRIHFPIPAAPVSYVLAASRDSPGDSPCPSLQTINCVFPFVSLHVTVDRHWPTHLCDQMVSSPNSSDLLSHKIAHGAKKLKMKQAPDKLLEDFRPCCVPIV